MNKPACRQTGNDEVTPQMCLHICCYLIGTLIDLCGHKSGAENDEVFLSQNTQNCTVWSVFVCVFCGIIFLSAVSKRFQLLDIENRNGRFEFYVNLHWHF